MAIRVKVKGADKAIIRWKNPMEKEWLLRNLCRMRDTNTTPIQLSIKDVKNEEIRYNLGDTPTIVPHPSPPPTMMPTQQVQPMPMPPPTNPKLRPDPETMKAIEIRPETKKGED